MESTYIDVDNGGGLNLITLSKSVLGTSTVSLSQNVFDRKYYLLLDEGVARAEFENSAKWSISGTTATFTDKCTKTGYYCDNVKIKYATKDKNVTLAKIDGLKSGTKVNEELPAYMLIITAVAVENFKSRMPLLSAIKLRSTELNLFMVVAITAVK